MSRDPVNASGAEHGAKSCFTSLKECLLTSFGDDEGRHRYAHHQVFLDRRLEDRISHHPGASLDRADEVLNRALQGAETRC